VIDDELSVTESEIEVSALDPAPEPESPSVPVEVVTVEDLLDRLVGEPQESGGPEEPPPGEDTTAPFGDDGPPSNETLTGPIEVVGMDTALKRLETIQAAVDHPMLTTPFEDYTVTEGLLLLLFLSAVVAACVKMLKGGFSWLR